MTDSPPLLIVTLPDRSIDGLHKRLFTLANSGADLAEIRVDRLPAAEGARLAELFPSPMPLVGTYRSEREGGEGSSEGPTRKAALDQLLSLPFRYVDLEPAQDAARAAQYHGARGAPKLILSSHLPDGSPVSRIRAAMALSKTRGALTKVVVSASVERLYSELRAVVLDAPTRAAHATLFTTGPSGPILRACARRYQLALVYAAPPLWAPGVEALPPVDPSQIPVDALVALWGHREPQRLFALLGHPVAHSPSPRIHTRWYLEERRPGLFVALDIGTSEELEDVLTPLHEDGFEGFSVTQPWKQAALLHANTASADARASGCANTLTYEEGGWAADNFDVSALVRRASELRNVRRWTGDDLLVLGAGGAARAALAAAQQLKVRARILARRRGPAEAVAREFGAELETSPSRIASLVVHATRAGRSEAPRLEIPWESHVERGSFVLDFVYRPEHTIVAELARRRGADYEDGGRLLVYQAVEAHRRWWGEYPAEPLVDQALREMGCAA